MGRESAVRIVVPRIVRPVGRRPDSPTVHARLLAAATEHLLRVGPRQFTLRAAADDLGMARVSVYRYFASKVALLDAVVGRWQSDVEANLTRIAEAPDPADDKIEHLLTALACLQREALIHEANLFAAHLDATMGARRVAKRHRVRLRSLVEHVVVEGMTAGTFVIRDRERAIAFVFDASYRFAHPLAIQQDADVPRDLANARLGAVIRTIQEVLRTGTL